MTPIPSPAVASLEVWVMVAGAGLAVVLTLVWIALHALCLFRLGGAGLTAASARIKQAWLLAVVGGFLGPCVMLAALASMGMALAERRQPDAHPATRQIANTLLLAGGLLMAMAAILVITTLIATALPR